MVHSAIQQGTIENTSLCEFSLTNLLRRMPESSLPEKHGPEQPNISVPTSKSQCSNIVKSSEDIDKKVIIPLPIRNFIKYPVFGSLE